MSSAMGGLVIRHAPGSDPATFSVVRLSDGKATDAVPVPSPAGFPVKDRPQSDLLRELAWYLERFLNYPFSPETEHAENVVAALKAWGEQAFSALFGSMRGRDWFRDAVKGQGGLAGLRIQVSSDDPEVLSWPWEALHDPETDFLALGCQIERRLNHVADPPELADLPKIRVNILLVTARPLKGDVAYRSISRPLVELIENQGLPAQVTVLRPPTLEQLRTHLAERPGQYHILHFDGHGGYGIAGRDGATASPFTLKAVEGHLVFEKEDGTEDPISAGKLSVLLREHRIPAVVLNACQSGMLDAGAEDPFASVAASLVRSGVRSVVAMAYSLYVSGAQRFLPAFYRRLFESGDTGEAVRAGRQGMYQHAGRVCARGEYPLQDWLVPVVYQQEPLDFSFAQDAEVAHERQELPREAADTENPYGFVGRDGALLELERALRRKPAGILVHGLGGVGKTTLARGFLKWLSQTGGLEHPPFWLSFQEIRNAEYVFNVLGAPLFGADFLTAPTDEKLEALARVFKQNAFVIVWDNFESACGIPGTAVQALLSSRDQQRLKRFLELIRGGASKVIVTSRSEEEWLGTTNRYKISLGGLQGEERWEYCSAILDDLGLSIDRDDQDLVELIDALDGHPLMMRAVLPKLQRGNHTAGSALVGLRNSLQALGLAGDDTQEKLWATLRFVEQSLPEDLQELLVPLSLHERFVDLDYLQAMASHNDAQWTRPKIDHFAAALVVAGLLRDRGHAIYELHPALTGYLRSFGRGVATLESWTRTFVGVMSAISDDVAPKPLHEQRFAYFVHAENFQAALEAAERLHLDEEFAAVAQAVAAYALNTRRFDAAEALFTKLFEHGIATGDSEGQASACHQLGIVAQERREFEAAEQWYLKALAIEEQFDLEEGAASSCHQLGMVAQERLDLIAAERWYLKSLAIEERRDNEHGAANTYHQLGIVAQKRRQFDTAEEWYLKSLAIEEKLGNEHEAASTYHQLGTIAQERRDFTAAEDWFLKSLEISKKFHDEQGAATTYHQLGIVAQERRDLTGAENSYLQALAIKERLGDEHGAATTYHQLGIVAQLRGDLAAAEKWYLKSFAISGKLADEYGVAATSHQIGIVAQARADFSGAETWYLKSLAIKEKIGDKHGITITYHQLGRLAQERGDFDVSETWYLKSLALREELGDEYGVFGSYYQLGVVAQARPDFAGAEMWYMKAIAIAEKLGDVHAAARTHGQLGVLAGLQERYVESGRWLLKAIRAFLEENDPERLQASATNFAIDVARASVEERATLKRMWAEAGVGAWPFDS